LRAIIQEPICPQAGSYKKILIDARFATIFKSATNIFSTSYSYFLDPFRLIYAQVTDCLYDTFMTAINPPGFNSKNYKSLYLNVYSNVINF